MVVGIKFLSALTICSVALSASIVDARHVSNVRENNGAGSMATYRALSPKQGRVFPGAVAIKKLVLLKFKKIVPISLILLKSSNDNEAELVPVYPTDQIPDNVQFIPTPNGISGHKDVQAIAIPSELHEQLQINGLTNLENIEALLQNAAVVDSDTNDLNVAAGAGSANIAVAQPEDVQLDVKEDDEDQLLEGVSAMATENNGKPTNSNNNVASSSSSPSSLRRLAADELIRSSLKSQPQQTTVEEIPLLLYSANDNSSPFTHISGNTGRLSGRRFVAATPVRRRFH